MLIKIDFLINAKHAQGSVSSFREGFILPAPAGSTRNEAALLIHGITASPAEMAGLANVLNNMGFRVTVPRLSGHTGRIEEFKRTTAEDWMSDVTHALEAEPAKKVIVIGVSFGALLGLRLATLYPKRVSLVVAMSPPIKLRSRFKELVLTLFSYLPDNLLNLLGFIRKSERGPDTFAVPHENLPVHSIGALSRLFKIRRQLKGALQQLACPLLILQDPFDHHVEPSSVDYLVDNAGSKEIAIDYFPGGEHELTVGHQHQAVFARISAFIEAHSGV